MIQPEHPSLAQSVTFVTDIERARYLIPSFLKKTLNADDKEWMTQFLSTLNQKGGSPAVEFIQEMAWVERSQQQLAQDAPVFDAHSGWQRMQGQLDAPGLMAKQQLSNALSLSTAMAWIKMQIHRQINNAASWWRKPMVGVLASAVIVGQMGLLAAVVKQVSQVQTVSESMSPASGAPSLEGMSVLTIVFKDSARLLDVRTLIDGVQGRVIDGPGALGVWLVAVPKVKLEVSLKRLSADKAIASVTPQ